MSHSRTVITVLAAALFAAGPAFAAGTKGESAADKDAYKGEHTMQGEVTSVDHKTGILGLKTHEGQLTLHYPPSALQNVKKGDNVSIELGIKESGAPSASPLQQGKEQKK